MNPVFAYLKTIYYDSKHPGSFGGEDKLYRAVRNDGKYEISRHTIKKFLRKQETFTVHKQYQRHFKRRQVIATYMDYMWDIDLAVFDSFKSANDNYLYFLLAIDIFSRYVWTVPLKSKKATDIVKALQQIFKGSRIPDYVRADKGTEFVNQKVKSFLKTHHVKFFVTHNSVKASYAERTIKSIKKKLVRIMTHRQSHKWIDNLKQVTESYNSSYHRGIGKIPKTVTGSDRYDFWKKRRNGLQRAPPSRFKFKIGDVVRVTYDRNVFSREYDERWSREEFIISSRYMKDNFIFYTIKDYTNEPITGSFYQKELQKITVDNNAQYKIEKEIKTRVRNRVKEVLVKWLGWPKKFNSWIPKTDVKTV